MSTKRHKSESHANGDKTIKDEKLEEFREESNQEFLTTDQGVKVNHTDDSLKAGVRGPTLMEDFHFREKITHFDHERIPERVVHARGTGAHGYFQVYQPMADLTKAHFLLDPSLKTPVFVRFSTVAGSRGSADTVRDARGFATKFYTQEGNFDLVGNNMPVFFIQDAIKFPDLVHALKPEPHNEMPQASSAHDTFWDFISLMPESMHMVMWLMSDRAIPRSYRMMEGFGVHTFRLINASGKSRFVKWHWKPVLGLHSMVWDEAQKMNGKDPDWHRRDLWNAIEMGNYPEFELGVQIIEPEDEFKFNFDLLDPTKLIPEELVPVQRIGKMVLNRNPDNFFAETEQVAFHLGNVVPGIDFSNDPLLQGRLFSYLDTQLIRLGGPNFTELPINRPVSEVHNNQRDGYHRTTINQGRTSYFPNSLRDGYPTPASQEEGGYVHNAEKVEGNKIRTRSESFLDFYSQARMFYHSMSLPEQVHITEALQFELGKVETLEIRQRMVALLDHVDSGLASKVALGIGVAGTGVKAAVPTRAQPLLEREPIPVTGKLSVERSPALSMLNTRKDSIHTRRVAVLVADGVDMHTLAPVHKALTEAGAQVEFIAKTMGLRPSSNGGEGLNIKKTYLTDSSIMYDALLVPGGRESVAALKMQGDAMMWVNETFKHCKTIGAIGEGIELLRQANLINTTLASAQERKVVNDKGVVTSMGDSAPFIREFIQAIAHDRHWEREDSKGQVPA